MKPDWILIANATHARLLSREAGSPMVVLESLEHPAGRQKIGDLADDRLGSEHTDRGFGGAAYEPRVDAKLKEHQRFARELAARLEMAAVAGKFHRLAVFASSPFLGELKAEMGAVSQRLLQSTHDLDLTSFGLAEVEERVARELAH